MHKSVWDVLFAGFCIMMGAMFMALLVAKSETLASYQRIGCMVASLGFISSGLYLVAVGYSGSGFLMAVGGIGWTAVAWPAILDLLRPHQQSSGPR